MRGGIAASHAHIFPDAEYPGTVERLRRLSAACGIGTVVCFAPFPYQMRGRGIDGNRWLHERIRDETGLAGFGTVDFERPDLRGQVGEVAALGFLGIKLHPAAQRFDILSPAAYEVYGAAEERGLFLSFHTGVHGYRLRHAALAGFDDIAQDFPKLRFSLEHIGGYHFFPEALAVMANNPGRVFGGLTSVFTPAIHKNWHLSTERMVELIAQAGAEQVIFGLDFPYNLEEETMAGIDCVQNKLGLTRDQAELILGGNLRRVLGLP
ncbi:MAG: amidohydrolase family protein [Patescibacteria group bacterium]